MPKHLSRGAKETRKSGRRADPWSQASLSAIVLVLATFVALPGCGGKVPTFGELINGKKKEETPAPAPQVAKTTTPPPARQEPPKEPEKPKRAPQEVVAEFNATPSERRTNQQLIELAGSPDAADQFTEIYVASSAVSDAGMAVLPKFEKVEKLTIDGCQYTNNALVNISKMKSLTTLSMIGGSVNEPSHTCDSGLAAIKEMHQLTSLAVQTANITPKGLAYIASMTWLENLNVSGTRFNDDSLEMLAPLVNLKELNISYTHVSDNGFRFLLPFTQLENLKIAHLPIRGEGLKKFSLAKGRVGLRALTAFEIAGMEQTGYEGIYNFKKTLEYLDLGQAQLTDDRFIRGVCPCTKLEVLLVHENPTFGDGGLTQVGRLKNLKRLYFYKNPGVTDASINNLAKLRKLESITLNSTGVSEQGARVLKRKLKNCAVEYNYKKVE